MLSQVETDKISQSIYTSDQDFFFWSGLYGEPFLFKNYLCYFDGETVTIAGYPLNSKLSGHKQSLELNELLSHWSADPAVQIINYYGPSRLNFHSALDRQFEKIYFLPPDTFNVDVFIDLSDPVLLRTSNAKESKRKISRKGLIITKSKRHHLTHQHITLIRNLALRADLQFSEATLLINILSVLQSDSLLFFEVESENNLLGFAVVHDYFQAMPFVVIACFNNSVKYVADAVYCSIIQHYKDTGHQKIGFGYSMDIGHLYFKTKWGGARTNLPYYQYIMKRKDYNTHSIDCINWVGRLLETKLGQNI